MMKLSFWVDQEFGQLDYLRTLCDFITLKPWGIEESQFVSLGGIFPPSPVHQPICVPQAIVTNVKSTSGLQKPRLNDVLQLT